MPEGAVHCVVFSPDDARLHEALRDTRLVPWNDVAVFTNVVGSFASVLRNLIHVKTERLFFQQNCDLFHCSVETALQIQLPE